MRPRTCLKTLLPCLVLALLAGCFNNDELEVEEGTSESELYDTAQKYLRKGSYELAVRHLQLLESRFPFGRHAEQAQLELIYAHYNNFEHEAAIEAAQRFMELHPQHPNVDYAFYMKGLASYTLNQGLLDRFLPGDKSQRDTSFARESFAEFSQLLGRFPESPYAADAKARMVHLRNLLARHEIVVANYYFKRGAWLAATNRGRHVVENFQQTPAVADGLAIMVQGYTLLGLEEAAQNALDVLVLNFPDYPALDAEGNFAPDFSAPRTGILSWLDRATFGLFGDRQSPVFDHRPPGATY